VSVQDYPPPKPVIPCFDGDLLTFWTFIRSFDTHIADKMPNDAARLVYLLQQCSPKVRQGLEHFSPDNTTGYRLARESIFNEYGQPYTIAYCCEQKLLGCRRLKTKDPGGLRDLFILMDKCLGIMEDIGDFATLNFFGTIQRITDKFSEEMQREWVRWAFGVLKETGQQAKFRELVEFVRHESEEANSLYGRSFFNGSGQQGVRSSVKGPAASFSTAVTSKKTTPTWSATGTRCPFCRSNHALASCADFKGISRHRRMEFLRKESRCFLCLARGHMINDCRSGNVCRVEGCGKKLHHTLLHRSVSNNAIPPNETEPPSKSMCAKLSGSARSEGGIEPYFMTIPVNVSNDTGAHNK